MITPQTDVILLKVPLEIDNNNQLTFADKEAQFNYFYNLPKLEVSDEDFTYQRKDGTIRVPALIDDIRSYNYVMYRNNNYTDKWFYAFIDDMEYANDAVTIVKIRTDTWQCWQFDLDYKPVLIDREHTNDDTVGSNTQPEGLELGDLVVNGDTINFGGVGGTGMSDYCVVVEVSMVENTGTNATLSYTWEGGGTYDTTPRLNSIYRGTIPLVIGILEGGNTPELATTIYEQAGLSDAIINVYMLPKSLIGSYHTIVLTANNQQGTTTTAKFAVPASTTGVTNISSSTFDKPTSLAGNFRPKNQKLLTYPYCYFNISNNAGVSMPYRYEDFPATVTFKTEGTFGLSGNVKSTPQNYKNISSNENALDYSISAPKYPVCSWNSDSYTNWLTQNAVNMRMQWITTGISGLANIGAGAIQGGGVGAVGGAIQAVGDLIGTAREQYLAKTQANLVPDQVQGNVNAGDFVWAKYRSPFTYLPMSIKPEYAQRIDEFWNCYGYKTNLVKLPNITGRRNWNFVRTIGCYIEADIPQQDLQEIKSMFNRGITFWHNPATFADYSQNNDII